MSIRIFSLFGSWQIIQISISTEVQRQNVIPMDSKIYPLFSLPLDIQRAKIERSFEHIIHYATINRNCFVPTLFALEGQHILRFKTKKQYASIVHKDKNKWKQYLPNYQYVWGYNISDNTKELLVRYSNMVYEEDDFSLHRIDD